MKHPDHRALRAEKPVPRKAFPRQRRELAVVKGKRRNNNQRQRQKDKEQRHISAIAYGQKPRFWD